MVVMNAHCTYSEDPESVDAGRAAGQALRSHFAPEITNVAIVYATMNHDHNAVLRGLRDALGEDTVILGCTAQGVVSNEFLTEDGFAIAVIGISGGVDLSCAVAVQREIQVDATEKGRLLAQALKRDLRGAPKVVVTLYDPLCGADVEALLGGMRTEIDCPIVGGAAGQPWGPPQRTYQFWDQEVFSHGVVALALSGPFGVEVGVCHGTVPTGIASVVTKAVGNHVLELDGRRAMDVWRETAGCRAEELVDQSHFATWALGVEVKGANGQVDRAIRGAFGFDAQTGGVILQAAVPEGTRVMMQHRTVEEVLNGSERMGIELATRLKERHPWAVLGFECGARTFPFLGPTNTRKEHELVRSLVAPEAPWCGMMAWGEIGPCAGRPAFHNYTYPLLVLTEER
jgi:hypothetical protein